MRVWIGVATAVLSVTSVAMLGAESALMISDRPIPEGIDVLGWDPQMQRIYYLVIGPSLNRNAPADSTRELRYFATTDSSAQQPHTILWARESIPDKAREIRSQVDSLRSWLTPMPPSPLPRFVAIAGSNSRRLQVEDYITSISDYRVTYNGLTGAWTTGSEVGSLLIRRIYLTPNGRDGVVILQKPSPPGSEFTLVMLISKLPHLPMGAEPNWKQREGR